MANIKILVLVAVLIFGADGTTDKGLDIDPEPPASSSEAPTTQSTSTTTPSTTTASTSAPTAPTKPTSPTTSSTTTSPTTVTTTTTTTQKPPTPTPTPAPVDPKVANWTVNFDNSNRSCIILQAAIQFEILDSKTNRTIKINVPEEATAMGSCEDNNKQNLKLSWGVNNSLQFDFSKSNTSFEVGDVITTLNSTLGDQVVYNLIHNASEFSTPLENSYKCAKEQKLNLTEANSNVTVAYLHVSHLQYQAFHNSTEHKFDSAQDCEGSITPDVVPIVVGCVLAALVVMVLIAYLVGRRRCQARGYLSM